MYCKRTGRGEILHLVTVVTVGWRLFKAVGQRVVRFGQIGLTHNGLK